MNEESKFAVRSCSRMRSSVSHSASFRALSRATRPAISAFAGTGAAMSRSSFSSLAASARAASVSSRANLVSRMVILSITSPQEVGIWGIFASPAFIAGTDMGPDDLQEKQEKYANRHSCAAPGRGLNGTDHAPIRCSQAPFPHHRPDRRRAPCSWSSWTARCWPRRLPSMARDLGVPAPSSVHRADLLPDQPGRSSSRCQRRIADRFGATHRVPQRHHCFPAGLHRLRARRPTSPSWSAARFFQGIGGALMLPVGRLVLMRSVEKRDLIQATQLGADPGRWWARSWARRSAALSSPI